MPITFYTLKICISPTLNSLLLTVSAAHPYAAAAATAVWAQNMAVLDIE